jgi:ADP-ribosylglycohydrolase
VVSTSAYEVVRAALFAVTTLGSQSEILKQCIDYTGDVDSIAAIAMGVSSLKSDVEKDLPVYLQLGLEDTTYGRTYLVELDKQLVSVNL